MAAQALRRPERRPRLHRAGPPRRLAAGGCSATSEDLVRSAMVGVVNVVVVEPQPASEGTGPRGWGLSNPRPLPRSILGHGVLGLWAVPPDVSHPHVRQQDG
jgi:hypothetical protein